jgi:tetratricopeptide (TPR) repeat protein
MTKLELTSLNCTNCGASLSGYEGLNEMQCEYCNTKIKILRPRHVDVVQGNLSTDNYDKLSNLVEILQKAIRAGNYNEGYEYCNKALEINPNIGSIWENKAICAFWRSVSFLNEDKITISNAREIRTFLNASKENDPNSESYEVTADAIGSNLAAIINIKLSALVPDAWESSKNSMGGSKQLLTAFSVAKASRLKDYLETLETAYEIMVNKDLDILKTLVLEYSNLGKGTWLVAKSAWKSATDESNMKSSITADNAGIDPLKKRDSLINRILKVDGNYEAPKINVKVISQTVKIILVAVFVIYMIGCLMAVNK